MVEELEDFTLVEGRAELGVLDDGATLLDGTLLEDTTIGLELEAMLDEATVLLKLEAITLPEETTIVLVGSTDELETTRLDETIRLEDANGLLDGS